MTNQIVTVQQKTEEKPKLSTEFGTRNLKSYKTKRTFTAMVVAARQHRKRREELGYKSHLPKISSILCSTDFKQIIGSFSSGDGVCALGALAKAAKNPISNETIDWHLIVNNYNVTIEELSRNVFCPVCHTQYHIGKMIPHLNDQHQYSFKEIGKYLKRFGL